MHDGERSRLSGLGCRFSGGVVCYREKGGLAWFDATDGGGGGRRRQFHSRKRECMGRIHLMCTINC